MRLMVDSLSLKVMRTFISCGNANEREALAENKFLGFETAFHGFETGFLICETKFLDFQDRSRGQGKFQDFETPFHFLRHGSNILRRTVHFLRTRKGSP